MTDSALPFRSVLSGLDTIEACYYLRRKPEADFDFEALTIIKEHLQANPREKFAQVEIGGQMIGVHRYGSKSGFPLVLEDSLFKIQCGEFNSPSFYVTFKSEALWRHGAARLHRAFLDWATAAGLQQLRPESMSRVDFTFDYYLPNVDFDEDSVLSLSAKTARYREDSEVQTLVFGKSDVVLRIYDKVAEIEQKSLKVWFYDLWGLKENVWRIEWQVRKDVLRRHSIRTFDDLFAGQGDVLRYLATEHDSLRIPTQDSNRSRWPLHPLWEDLIGQIGTLSCQGVYREIDPEAALNERLARIAIAVYGYCKPVAAITALQQNRDTVPLGQALGRLSRLIERIHEPLSWYADVESRRQQLQIGRE